MSHIEKIESEVVKLLVSKYNYSEVEANDIIEAHDADFIEMVQEGYFPKEIANELNFLETYEA